MLFATSIKMVEYDALGKTTSALEHFQWHLDAYFQLDAFVFMLIESRNQLPGPLLNKAWSLVPDVFEHHPELMSDDTNELYGAVRSLTLRSWTAREASVVPHRLDPIPVPKVILALRARVSHSARAEFASDHVSHGHVAERMDIGEHQPLETERDMGKISTYNGGSDLSLEGSDVTVMGDEWSFDHEMEWDLWRDLLGNAGQQWYGLP